MTEILISTLIVLILLAGLAALVRWARRGVVLGLEGVHLRAPDALNARFPASHRAL